MEHYLKTRETTFTMFALLVFLLMLNDSSLAQVIADNCIFPPVRNVSHRIESCTLYVSWDPPATQSNPPAAQSNISATQTNCSTCTLRNYRVRHGQSSVTATSTNAAVHIPSLKISDVDVFAFYGNHCQKYSPEATQHVDIKENSVIVIGGPFKEFESGAIECRVTGAHKRYNITWEHTINQVVVKRFAERGNCHVLTINNASYQDTGNYTCMATVNKCNNSEPSVSLSATQYVHVEVRPKLLSGPQTLTTQDGGKATGKFVFYCDPRPCYSWIRKIYNDMNLNQTVTNITLHDGETDIEVIYNKVQFPVLIAIVEIQPARVHDTGKYEIEIKNEIGSSHVFFDVKISGNDSKDGMLLFLIVSGTSAFVVLVSVGVILAAVYRRRTSKLSIGETSEQGNNHQNENGQDEIANPERDSAMGRQNKTYESCYIQFDIYEFDADDMYENQFAPGFDMDRHGN